MDKLVSSQDFLKLEYSQDLTRAGIQYVCHYLLNFLNDADEKIDFDTLREMVAQKAVELAFRRHLVQTNIPHQVAEPNTFTEKDYHDIALGGRRCDVMVGLVSRKEDITRIRKTPEIMLNELALAPSAESNPGHISKEDIVLFALATGLVTRNWDDIRAAQAAGQPHYIMYPMPRKWAQPKKWRELNGLSLKSDVDESLEVEIGGQDRGRRFQREQIILPPRTRIETQKKFWSVFYLHIRDSVDGRVGIHHPRLNETILIRPRQWANLWVYGMEIILLGYLQRAELHSTAERVRAGTRTLQAPYGTRKEYLGIPIRKLRSIEDLYTRTRKWATQL